MLLRPTRKRAASTSAVWYDRWVMLGHIQQPSSQAPISRRRAAVSWTTWRLPSRLRPLSMAVFATGFPYHRPSASFTDSPARTRK